MRRRVADWALWWSDVLREFSFWLWPVPSCPPGGYRDREPQPTDGPDYHEDHAAWVRRNDGPGEAT